METKGILYLENISIKYSALDLAYITVHVSADKRIQDYFCWKDL
jgi:hypothetical protein